MSLTKATYSMIEGAPANVADFGAVSGGSAAANTIAFNAWIAYLNASPVGLGYIPSGSYDIDGNLNPFTRAVVVFGGGYSSVVRFTSATAQGFDFQVSGSALQNMSVKHINADGGTNQSAGWLVKFSHPTELNRGSSVSDILFVGGIRQITINSCTGFRVDHCLFFDPKSTSLSYSIYIENTFASDAGDNFLTNNVFACANDAGSAGRVAIYHISGGGLFRTGNKFLYYDYHYLMELGAGVLTSITNTSNDSMEHAVIASQAYRSAFADNGFEAVTYTGNHFGSNEVDILFDTNAANPDWISAIKIDSNNSTKANVGIRFYSGANITIKDHMMTGLGGAIGIETAAAVDDVRLGGTKVSGFTTPYSLASTKTYIERYPIAVTGTATLSGGAWGPGGLFFGNATITLPAAFAGGIANAFIRIEITGGGGSGAGVSGFVDSLISETSFSIVVLGTVTGNTVPYRVVVEGY